MNIFNKVTLQSLKKNRTRTIVTIIGIILSAAMICAVTTFASSIYNYALDNAIYVDGDWHGSAEDIDSKTYERIKDDSKIKSYVYAQQLGYSKIEDCKNENKPYLFLLGASDSFNEMMPVHITSGKYPTSSSEIIIPEHLFENGGVELKIGDTLQLALGVRMLDGYPMSQNNPFYVYDENNEAVPSGETLTVKETRSYKIVGFYERPSFENYTAPGYTAITIADKQISEKYSYNVWFKMNETKDVYSFIEDNKLPGKTNSSVLRYSGVSRYTGFNSMILSLSIIVISLIMLGSISLIYNAFSISVAERTKQFGLLSSVGATKKQLRRMVVSEALMVSAIGIPLGILAGVGGIGITLFFVGNKFEALIGYPIPLKLSVSVLSLVIAVVIALLTVLISAIVPSKRATKVSAIEAIRQSKDINTKIKKVRTSKLTYKLFGLPGMLANKYYKRSRKKYRATVLSLFMSVILFVSASAFTGALTESVTDSFGNVKYDIYIYGFEEEFGNSSVDELLSELKKD
ncbi:MAG: ABC transporter permease, partial [Ruminococcus sp.]|nr:ABC transporter permease [Ruminococcus sp.]